MKFEKCVDAIARTDNGEVVLVERLSEPEGLAFVGGRIDGNELPVDAIIREFHEETGMAFEPTYVLGYYDDRGRDPRGPKASTVFVGTAEGTPRDEPKKTKVVLLSLEELCLREDELVFDHATIFDDYLIREVVTL